MVAVFLWYLRSWSGPVPSPPQHRVRLTVVRRHHEGVGRRVARRSSAAVLEGAVGVAAVLELPVQAEEVHRCGRGGWRGGGGVLVNKVQHEHAAELGEENPGSSQQAAWRRAAAHWGENDATQASAGSNAAVTEQDFLSRLQYLMPSGAATFFLDQIKVKKFLQWELKKKEKKKEKMLRKRNKKKKCGRSLTVRLESRTN